LFVGAKRAVSLAGAFLACQYRPAKRSRGASSRLRRTGALADSLSPIASPPACPVRPNFGRVAAAESGYQSEMPYYRYYRELPRARVQNALLVLRVVAVALSVFLVLPYLLTPLYAIVNPVSTLMLWRWVTGQTVERQVIPLERMGKHLPINVMVAEDARFCSHYGVDFQELREVIDNADDPGEMRGVSTIPQQTVKNLFLWPGRSYIRKALEVPLAMWFDLVLSKRRIMEIYLNIVQWGPDGEFGAEAAARRDFDRPAATLTRREAALMAASLPNPIIRDPRRPGRGLSRLARLYESRAARFQGADCLGLGR
jgi:monofunctional biosynthetic peptidoglycan transglycosylase